MADELEATFGRRPRGAWLAERVWEPDLPTALVSAGYDWTVLDDAHFRAAAIPEDDLWGSYTTDDQGKVLTVFGTEQGLRYRIPFAEVEDVIGYLREHATEDGERLGTMGDDGEKFGAWPTTWDHCWGEGRWVERFFDALDANADWLTTTPPSDWTVAHRPVGPGLPAHRAPTPRWASGPCRPTRAIAFGDRSPSGAGRASARGALAARRDLAQLPGPLPRDQRHPQADARDERSRRRACRRDRSRPSARDQLYAGQSNDCYWHGLFGGIYLPDLRVAALSAPDRSRGPRDRRLRAAPAVSRTSTSTIATRPSSRAPGEFVTVKLEEGGGIARWDLRAAAHPLAAVMRRRPEAYHETLRDPRDRRTTPGETTEGGAPELDPRHRPGQAGGPARPPPLRRLRAAVRPDPDPARPTPGPRLPSRERPPSSATCATAPGRSTALETGPGRRDAPVGAVRGSDGSMIPVDAVRTDDGRRRPARPHARRGPRDHPCGPVGRPADRRDRGGRVVDDAARRRRQPVPPGSRSAERANSPRRDAGSISAADRLAAGNDHLGITGRHDDVDHALNAVDGADPDGLELRGRLRARLPGQHDALRRAAPAPAG